MKLRTFLLAHAPALGWATPAVALKAMQSITPADTTGALAAHGRGPASSPEATPYAGAVIVLAALAGGPLAKSGAAARALYVTRPAGTDSGVASLVTDPMPDAPLGACLVTGAGCLGDAIKAVLGDRQLAAQVDRIEVRHGGGPSATIIMADGRETRFVNAWDARRHEAWDTGGRVRTVATIGGPLLVAMAADLSGATP